MPAGGLFGDGGTGGGPGGAGPAEAPADNQPVSVACRQLGGTGDHLVPGAAVIREDWPPLSVKALRRSTRDKRNTCQTTDCPSLAAVVLTKRAEDGGLLATAVCSRHAWEPEKDAITWYPALIEAPY